MTKDIRVKKVNPADLAHLLAMGLGGLSAIWACIAAVVGIVFVRWGGSNLTPHMPEFFVLVVALPAFYYAFGWIGGYLLGFLTNLYAKHVGGIRVTVETDEADA